MKVRKKPIEVEAVQYTGSNIEELWDWAGVSDIYGPVEDDTSAYINTLEGRMEAKPGWWIIKGVKGELYPCDPDVFDKSYDKEGEYVSESDVEKCTCETPTFGQDLVVLLNRHSMENYSGTPDWILGNFLEMVLRQFDCAVAMRADWRGESTELPALQEFNLTGSKGFIEASKGQVEAGLKEGLTSVNQLRRDNGNQEAEAGGRAGSP